MKTLPLLAFSGFAVFGHVGGRGSADPPGPSAPTATATIPSPRAPDDCRGGQDDAVTVELEPERIVAGRGGDRMFIGVHVHPHLADETAVVGAVEIIDDRGRRIGRPHALDARALPARAPTAYQIETPHQLADGYYRLQASVLARAARAGGADDFSTHQLYLHVAGGALTPITVDEWLTQSASGLAYTSP